MEKAKRTAVSSFAWLFPAALGLGTGMGALLHNIGVGLGIGAAVGVTASLLADWITSHKS
jgi:hypothetical protein